MEEESEASNVLKTTSDPANNPPSEDNLNEDESTKRLLETLSSPSEDVCDNPQEDVAKDNTDPSKSDFSTGDTGPSDKDTKIDEDLENSAIFQEIEKYMEVWNALKQVPKMMKLRKGQARRLMTNEVMKTKIHW